MEQARISISPLSTAQLLQKGSNKFLGNNSRHIFRITVILCVGCLLFDPVTLALLSPYSGGKISDVALYVWRSLIVSLILFYLGSTCMWMLHWYFHGFFVIRNLMIDAIVTLFDIQMDEEQFPRNTKDEATMAKMPLTPIPLSASSTSIPYLSKFHPVSYKGIPQVHFDKQSSSQSCHRGNRGLRSSHNQRKSIPSSASNNLFEYYQQQRQQIRQVFT
ncbi:hypothetical protein V1511DRAFT_493096 [Dipodascopsis uninucleata]